MSTTKCVNNWDVAIFDAEKKLAKTRLAVVEIERAIENLKRYKARGDAWPGNKAAGYQVKIAGRKKRRIHREAFANEQ